jgi:cobalt/nickel transport system permease protein
MAAGAFCSPLAFFPAQMTLALEQLPARNSRLGRLDPRWRLAALLLLAAAAAVLHTVPAAAAACAGAVALALAARLPLRWYLARVAVVAPFLALFALWMPFFLDAAGPAWRLGPLKVSGHGVQVALLLCLKALTIVTAMLVLLATAPLHVSLAAAHALRVPGLLVSLTLLTYRYAFLLAHELTRVRIALRVRGYRNRASLHSYRTVGHVAGMLLVRSYERAERVDQAMRCRAFDGRFRCLTEFRTTATDVAVFLVVVGGAAGLVAWDVVQR